MESSDINVSCEYGPNVRLYLSGKSGRSVEIFLTSQSAIEVGEALIKGGKLSEKRPPWPNGRIPEAYVRWK